LVFVSVYRIGDGGGGRNAELPFVRGGSPADLAKFIQSEIARYAGIVKAPGAKVE